MAATGIGNSVGAVQVFDYGAPCVIGGQVFKTTCSGGVFVFGSTATGVVSSGLNSFVQSDLKFEPNASGCAFTGIALNSASSGLDIAVATRGVFLLDCNGTVDCGQLVMCDGNNAVQSIARHAESGAVGALMAIGRAITAGASGGYAVVQIGL